MNLPLDGIRVVEIGHSIAAPYAALALAELGAEVIKIERPGVGDDARLWGASVEGAAPTFHAMNRLKRAVALDLKSDEGRATVHRLATISDVVIQNQKPGLARKLGFDAETLRALNPGLVYANIHAFGDRGPLAGKPGYDPLMQAFGGLISVTGRPGEPSVRIGPSIIDCGTGMWAVIGVLAALLARTRTGKGATVDTALFETALGWMVYFLPIFTATGRPPGKAGSGTVMIVPYQIFRCADGELMIAAGNDSLFARLARVLENPGWADDPRFLRNPDRVANREVLCALIEGETAKRPLARLAAALEAEGIPHAPVQDMGEVARHPQTEAIAIKRGAAPLEFFGLPVRFDGARPDREGSAPGLGADDGWLADLLERHDRTGGET